MARVEMPNSRARSAMAKRSRFSLSRRFTLFPLHCLVLLAELFLAELADERFGQLVLEDDLARHFKFVETIGDEFLQLRLAYRLPGLQFDEGDHGFAAMVVGHADDRGFIDRGAGDERFLDGTGIDVEAGGDDEILDAVDE